MVIFHSYVSLPEGKCTDTNDLATPTIIPNNPTTPQLRGEDCQSSYHGFFNPNMSHCISWRYPHIPIYPPTNNIKPCHFWGLKNNDFPLRILYWLGDSQGWVTRGWGWYIHSVEPAKSQQKIPKKSVVKPSYPPMSYHKKNIVLNFRGFRNHIYIYNTYIFKKKKTYLPHVYPGKHLLHPKSRCSPWATLRGAALHGDHWAQTPWCFLL